MSLLNSKFDIVTVDNPVSVAALAAVLKVNTASQTNYNSNGTPVTDPDITFPPGTIVTYDTNGYAVAATADATTKQLFFVTVDGNTDYSGSFVQKLTCLHGGYTMVTDQFDTTGGTFTKGKPVTVVAGKIAIVDADTNTTFQIYGFVGPDGYDATNGTLQVIVPQGVGI